MLPSRDGTETFSFLGELFCAREILNIIIIIIIIIIKVGMYFHLWANFENFEIRTNQFDCTGFNL
jgi:hypothetical protein